MITIKLNLLLNVSLNNKLLEKFNPFFSKSSVTTTAKSGKSSGEDVADPSVTPPDEN